MSIVKDTQKTSLAKTANVRGMLTTVSISAYSTGLLNKTEYQIMNKIKIIKIFSF